MRHTGTQGVQNNLFIYAPDGTVLLSNSTPNGPGLNGIYASPEIQVIKVPETIDEWYIIYSRYKDPSGAPAGDESYWPAVICYSRVKYELRQLEILERDVPIKVNGQTYTYTHGKALTAPASLSPDLYLILCRRSMYQNSFSLDRFIVSQQGISFDKNTGDVDAEWFILTIADSEVDVSIDGKRIAVDNRVEDHGFTNLIIFDATAFDNQPGHIQKIYLPELILEPDGIIQLTPQTISQVANSNPNLQFLYNLDRKVNGIEFSPNGRYLYFLGGGYYMASYTNATYLGQIDLGEYSNPNSYPYNVRLQIQKPPGTFDWYTGLGGSISANNGHIKHIYHSEYAYNGKIYLTKLNGGTKLWVIPHPNDPMPQMLTPGEIDLSDAQNPNIEVGGDFNLVPDKADDYNYDKFDPENIWLGNDTTLCINSSFDLGTSYDYVTYYWQDGSTGPSITVSQPGDYWVEAMDQNGCYSRDTININLIGVGVHLGNDTSFCQGEVLTLDPGSGYQSYLWQDGSTNQVMQINNTGEYWVEVSSFNSCTARDSIYVSIRPNPDVNLGNDTSLKPGETLQLDAGSGMDSYYWQDGSTQQNYEVTETGTYWVIVTKDQCTSIDTIQVIYDDCEATLFVPNVFTPNGDGFNETFKPVSQNLSSFEMLIFNRWGQLLFETQDPEAGWDGKANGRPCAVSTYFYLIRYTTLCNSGLAKDGTLKGGVTLLE